MSKLKKALLKAKVARETGSADTFTETSAFEKQTNRNLNDKKPRKRKELEVEYQHTKVINLDPNVLRKNKLFSLFKNNKMTDYFDIAKGQLLKKLDQLNGNCIIVTSVHPGEGKTFTSINLAISIAREHDRTVLIVDTDLRNPWRNHRDFAHDFFSLKPEKGLVDYLENDAELGDIILNPGINKLTIIPAGRRAFNSAELLSSPRMEYLVNELKTHYGNERIILFDCPASLACVDPIVFAQFIDGILFVVESDRTTNEELKKAMDLFKGNPILGVIFNKSKDKDDTEADE
ncbi:MAG: polysaccharide biosynthesis tyrosine autokinase [Desulfobacteraceae bacterium]|jgi:non-specific protein-tyrosine kinase